MTSKTSTDDGSDDRSNDWRVEVLYDGDCPLCLREINLLRWMDGKKRIRFTDIAAEDFSTDEFGIDMETLMAEIHGRLPPDAEHPNGKIIIGVEVFRHLYSAVGFGWIVGVTRLPIISHGLDLGYRFFAKYRLKFTGRCKGDSCEI